MSRQGHNGVRVTSPAPREAWEAAVATDPNVLVSHTPAWIDLVCSFGGYADASRLYELRSGRRLVLPMVRRRHLPRPLAPEDSLPPCWDAGGIVAPGGITARDLQAVFEDLTARPVVRTALRPGPLDAREWDAARPQEPDAGEPDRDPAQVGRRPHCGFPSRRRCRRAKR